MSEYAGASQPPVAASKNPFARIAGVLFAPAETFEDIRRKPDFVVPLIVILLIGYVSLFLLIPHMDLQAMQQQQREAMQARGMSQQDIDQQMKIAGKFGQVITYLVPLFGLIWIFIVAGVLYLAFRIMGGDATFHQALSTVFYSWMPLVIGGIITTIVVMMRGKVDPSMMGNIVKSHLGILTNAKDHPVLFALLSAIDLFNIWTVVLLIIGFAIMSRFSKMKSAVIVLTMWFLAILLKCGLATLSTLGKKA